MSNQANLEHSRYRNPQLHEDMKVARVVKFDLTGKCFWLTIPRRQAAQLIKQMDLFHTTWVEDGANVIYMWK